MTQPIHYTAGNHSAPLSERGLDCYAKPSGTTDMMLNTAGFEPCRVWTPFGDRDSAIYHDLVERGFKVTANDIRVDGVDFFERRKAPKGCDLIVENMPFKCTARGIEHGLTLVHRVVVLQRIQFLESDRRGPLFDQGKLVHLWIHRKRVARMHREGWEGKHAAPAMMLAWFMFDRDHDGSDPTFSWIKSRKEGETDG